MATWSVSANPNPVNENGGQITVTVSRSSGTGSATVYLSTLHDVQGYSSISGSGDYNGLNNLAVSFASGVTSQQVTIGINDLGLTSGSKTFGLLLQSVNSTSLTANVLASNSFTINDNDASPSAIPTFSIGSAGAVAEGNNAGFTVTMSGSINLPKTIWYSTLIGTASSANGDYSGAINQPLTFQPGGPIPYKSLFQHT